MDKKETNDIAVKIFADKNCSQVFSDVILKVAACVMDSTNAKSVTQTGESAPSPIFPNGLEFKLVAKHKKEANNDK